MNEYYTRQVDPLPYTRGKTTQLTEPLDRIELAFDKLPAPHATKQGFSDPVPVGDATALDEAPSTQQLIKQTLMYAAATGTNDYTVSLPVAPSSYAVGLTVFITGTENTGACTINVNGLGVKAIKHSNGTELVPGEIKGIFGLIYDGTKFQPLCNLPPYEDLAEGYAADAAASVAEAEAAVAEAEAHVATALGHVLTAQDYATTAGEYATMANVNYATFIKYG